ncbi:monooxygenase [Salmonella enterica subsp. enterica]|uniref:Monooxygenase n=1 Tax=Salmonella enterica I TaxID=59201 RepID=A0A379WU82_SALET|nr:monooxygenase [Salmonella enterica subsp. enterica]
MAAEALSEKKLGVSFPGRTLGIHALVADASLSGLNRDVWHILTMAIWRG